jgi:transposase-like protein
MEIPHCPNPACSCFHAPPAHPWHIRYGCHRTRAFGTVPRFRCKVCGRTFSTQTFSLDYYAKKRICYTTLLIHLVTASGLLDMARHLTVRVESIENRFERLARCCLALHRDILARLPMRENMAADGLESFSCSQYYPNHITVFAGSDSEFIYTLGFANLRRKGRMTAAQKKKRALLEATGKADPKALERSFLNLLTDLKKHLSAQGVTPATLFTDEHRAYRRAVSRMPDFPLFFRHVTLSSKEPRVKNNPLFPVNYVDRQIRKDVSDHARETVQFARCPSALMARMSVYQFYHNCCLPRRVRESRRGNTETHAQRAGLPREQLDAVVRRHWGKRVFLQKLTLGSEDLKTWMCAWRNPGVPFGRYIPKYIAV